MLLQHASTHRLPRRSCHTGHRRNAGARRSTLLVLMVCLSLATAVALLGAGDALTEAGIAAPRASPAAANAQLVRDFYAAVNDTVRTGNSHALDAIVAPAFAWCRPCPGQPPTRAGFTRYLADLHRTAPGVRLAVDSVVAGSEETVTARVRVAGYPLVGDPPPWGPVDTLRLAGGLIVELRTGPDDVALVEPLLRAQLDRLPPAATGVALARLTFPLDSRVSGLLSAGPTLLVVESGALSVRIASGGRIRRANGDESTAGNGMGLAAVLHPGDAAIVQPGMRHEFRQHGAEPAVALGTTLVFIADGRAQHPPRRPELVPFVPPDEVLRDARPQPLPTVSRLAGGDVEEWPAGPVDVALGRVVLGPGAAMVPPPDEAVLFAVEAGTLGLVGGDERTIAAGTGVVLPAGAGQEVRNADSGLLVGLVLTVAADAT